MVKRGWILLLILLCVAFLISCGKSTEPDEAKGEFVKTEREGNLNGYPFFFVAKYETVLLENTANVKGYNTTLLKFKKLLA